MNTWHLKHQLIFMAVPVTAIALSTATARGGYYETDASRGTAREVFSAPESGFAEECVLPRHFPEGTYSQQDTADERRLCGYDFHGLTAGKLHVPSCPKLWSTNPALVLYQLPSGSSVASFEQERCEKRNRGARPVALFKQSITCSYAPSILAYYHVSRILDAGRVPVAVIRTVEKGNHLEAVQRAAAFARRIYGKNEIVRRAWESDWVRAHANPDGNRKKPFPAGVSARWLFTSDYKGVYGALLNYVQGVRSYGEVSGNYTYKTRYQTFQQQPAFRRLLDGRPVSEMLGRSLADAAQTIVQMKDVGDMILLDFVLNQQDRVGNIHYRRTWYYLQDGKIHTEAARFSGGGVDKEQSHEMTALAAVLVKEMVLVDNDCGVAKSNMARRHGLLSQIRHLSPQTYRRLLGLERTLEAPEWQEFFEKELLFSRTDLHSEKEGLLTNLKDAVSLLKARCHSGQLHLDLDLEAHLNASEIDEEMLCDLP